MERLANLLPQLIAQNQMLIRVLTESEPSADSEQTYLDGTPVRAVRAARS